MSSPAPILVPTLEELAGEFDRLLAADNAAEAAVNADPKNAALNDASDMTCAALMDCCSAISVLAAQNAEHVRLKARALDWLAFSQGEPEDAADKMAYQLVRALLDGVPS